MKIQTVILLGSLSFATSFGITQDTPTILYRIRSASELFAAGMVNYTYTGIFSNRTDSVPSLYRTMLALEALAGSSEFSMSNIVVSGNITYTNSVWDDSQVPGLAFRTGATAPTFGNFTDANIQCYRFVGSQDDTVHGSIQLSHRYKAGSTLKPHIHVAPLTAGTTNCVWWFYYSITNVNSAFPASTLIKVTNNLVGVPQYAHKIISLGDIANSAGRASDVMMLTITREGTDAEDKDPADIALLSFDLHFEIDKPGSDNEIP